MAKAKFDIKTLELPAVAAKPLYAGVGATDLAVEYVREAVADVQKKFTAVQKDVQTRVATVQKNVTGLEFEPKALRSDALAQVEKVQTRVNENVATVTDTYGDLAKRGESLVARIRKQEATKATAASAKTTTTKAKTTTTQAKKAVKKSSSSAKATRTSAKKTASNAAKATSAGASKVGN
ncbi:MAG TPA: hypothetical protein VNQ53_11880 [Nocardioides sp.]|nr:hypothetical protein [Nocardioides sp.]